MKKLIFLYGLPVLVLYFIWSTYSHTKELYINGIGQNQAKVFSSELVSYYKERGYIPVTLIEGFAKSGVLSDQNGVNFIFNQLSEESFEIEYTPKIKKRLFFGRGGDQVLLIKWSKEMDEMLVESSIERP